jgi:Spy/CpxP family protein refolding chaperone
MERAIRVGPPGKWWKNPDMAQKLGLTADQQKKMDDIFQDSRLKLIDLNAALEKDEAILEPLVDADQPDEGKILTQIDRVAQGRADLEKANARMLLGIRRVLTPEQWKKLAADAPPPHGGPGDHPGGRGNPGQPGGPSRGNIPPPPPGD